MATLTFRITPAFVGACSLGTLPAIRLLQERLKLDLASAKSRVDRAVFSGEEVSVELPSPEAGWQLARELETSAAPARLQAWVERGRLAQDYAFEAGELVGQRVVHLLGVADADRPDTLCLLYVKTDAPPWHRLFLDVGFACWEDWGRPYEDDDDSFVTRDLGQEWGLVGEEVSSAGAYEDDPRDGATTIRLRFASGAEVELLFVDPKDPDSAATVAFKRPSR